MEELLEDTVSTWIEEDVEEIIEYRERVTEQRLAHTGDGRGEHAASPAPAPQPRPSRRPDRSGRSSRSGRSLWPRRAGQAEALPGGVTLPGGDSPAPTQAPSHAAAASSSHDGDHDDDDGTHGSDHGSKYPRSLHADPSRPHLAVRKVDAAGVRFAFDAKWLESEGFRASMPMRCVFSGVTAKAKLIARPLIFKDRLSHRTPENVVEGHENNQIGDLTPRQVASRMGTLEHLPAPFSQAMPYYVSTRFAHLAIHTRVRDRSDGSVMCEVVVPDASTALEWLGRVNGVCGKDYEMLEADATLLHGDAWQQLSDAARQRIGVWCKFTPHEVVRHFFGDADFGRHDEGLAGLLITDHRLVFHKYHHGGEAPLNAENAAILARPEGSFVSLTLRMGNDLSRMIKLHRSDFDRLAAALQERGSIGLIVSE